MTTCTDSGDVPAYTLQPLLQHRSAPIEWKQFQLFLSWLMSNAARTKCPLNLRQGRPRSHHNVLVAVPYLDADYLMDDLDALSIIFRGTQGSNLNRLCNPRISDDSVSCNILKRLLLMEKINTDSVPRSIRAFTLGRAELRHTEGWDFIFENAIITPSDSSAAVSNTVTETVSEEQFVAILMANVTRSRRICKNRDELTEDIEHYIASEFTPILDSICNDDADTQSNDIEKAEDGSNTQEATATETIPSHFDKELLRKYAATAYKLKDDCDFGRTFAIDCEMVTAGGVTALARITIVDSLLNIVFDALVKPDGDIQDYRTPYSGITAESLEDVTIRLSDIQDCLNMLIGPDTILVGHSLDNDLKACEIAHFNVLDTALQYIAPRRHNKPSLKSLVKQHIGIELVRDSGHDSYVDASTTMFLAMEGVMTLTPGVRTLVDILDPRACGLMEDAEILSTSQVHLYDPMASDYQSILPPSIILEPTDSDAASVNAFSAFLRDKDAAEPSNHIIVLRDFQKLCYRKVFEGPKNEESCCLIKRVNPKAVCSYLKQLGSTLESLASMLDHEDIMLVSNLSGDCCKVDILSIAMYPANFRRMKRLKRMLCRMYAIGHGLPVPSSVSSDEDIPEEVTNLYRRSQGIMLETLRSDHETAVRDRGNSWVAMLSKQVSNKRGHGQ